MNLKSPEYQYLMMLMKEDEKLTVGDAAMKLHQKQIKSRQARS